MLQNPWKRKPQPGNPSQQLIRLSVVAVIAAPTLIYLLFFDVKMRVEAGIREVASARSIWQTMSNSLPETSRPGLTEAAFWITILVLLAGFLATLWFVLEHLETADDSSADLGLTVEPGSDVSPPSSIQNPSLITDSM